MNAAPLQRTWFIAYKELLHILRDPQTLFFTLFVPIGEMFLLGYAINTNVRHVRTVVADFANTQESRALITRFENSQDFKVALHAYSERQAHQALFDGQAQVAIVIPPDYSQKLQAGATSPFQILVDGTTSAIAGEAINVGNSLALSESLSRVLHEQPLPVEARPRVLFNPDTRSANFFLPGLMVVVCQMMATILSSTAIVREKELGTLEQLSITPIRRGELILGKMAPYVVLTGLEFCLFAFLMRAAFQISIQGYFVTLLSLLLPFTLTMLGFGLMISTKAETREAAAQMAMGTIIPSIFLSGYVFPVDSMPYTFQMVANFIPTTWLIDATRGVILRGTDWSALSTHALVLWTMAIVVITISAVKLRRQA